MEVQAEAKGLFAALFDFSFSAFVTTKVVKFLYGLGLLLGALAGLFWLITGFSGGATSGILALILVPLGLLLYIMYLRVVLEVLIVIFRIAENTAQIANRPS